MRHLKFFALTLGVLFSSISLGAAEETRRLATIEEEDTQEKPQEQQEDTQDSPSKIFTDLKSERQLTNEEGEALAQRLKALLEGKSSVSIKVEGEPMLHLAVKNKAVALTELLLKNGADVNEEDSNGETALKKYFTDDASSFFDGVKLFFEGHHTLSKMKMDERERAADCRNLLVKYKFRESLRKSGISVPREGKKLRKGPPKI